MQGITLLTAYQKSCSDTARIVQQDVSIHQ